LTASIAAQGDAAARRVRSMRAIVVDNPGGPDALVEADVPARA
jgi:hypothetical protein